MLVKKAIKKIISSTNKKRRVVDINDVPDKYKPLVKKIIVGSPIWGSHQTIKFPDGFILKGGRDESRLQQFNLPSDLAGSKVLDIGCNIGAISLECKKRDAEVVGLDYKDNLIECAKEISTFFDFDIDYRVFNLKTDHIDEQFDYTFFLNIYHHLDEKNRLDVLRMIDSITIKKLFFEAPHEGDIVANTNKCFTTDDYLGYLKGFTTFNKVEVTGVTDFGRTLITCSR